MSEECDEKAAPYPTMDDWLALQPRVASVVSNLSELERSNGRVAWRAVDNAGGFLTFDEYDAAMAKETYFTPFNWLDGWGDSSVWKANNDKLCAFAAVKMGLLRQTSKGYVLA